MVLKKRMLCACCLLPFIGWSAETASTQEELMAIEKEIQTLEERWHQINLKEMKEDVEGQGLMIADWEGYRRQLELIRQQEKEDDQIERRIKELEKRKAQLLNPSQSH
jgi:chromosome segregation ATPase